MKDYLNLVYAPSIDSGLSVSRIGSAAQTPIIKKLGGKSRMALAQYRELAAFSQFSSDLDESTKKLLKKGQIATEIFKQPQYHPMSVAQMAISLYLINTDHLDHLELKDICQYEHELQHYIAHHEKSLLESIEKNPKLSEELEKKLADIIARFHTNSEWVDG